MSRLRGHSGVPIPVAHVRALEREIEFVDRIIGIIDLRFARLRAYIPLVDVLQPV